MSQLFDIGSPSQSIPSEIRTPIVRLIQGYRALAGFSDDPLQRALTLQDLLSGTVSYGNGVTRPIGGSAGGGSTTDPEEPDLTPPPTVTGLEASAGFSYVFVEWNPPTYTEGRGHLQTNIYAALREAADPEPTFASAVLVYSATGALTNAAIPSEPNTIWHIWAKWETVDGIESTAPAGGLNGVEVTTGQDVSHVLEVLTGQITASQLHATLGARIDLIDASSAVAGSVNQRIAAVQEQVNDLLDTPEYDNATAYDNPDVVTYDGGLYRALGPTTGNLPTDTDYWQKIGDYASLSEAVAAHALQLEDHETRITTNTSGVSAEVSAREALAAQIRGSYTGTDPSALVTGLMFNERQARVTAEGAIVSSVSTLSATVTSNYSTLSAAQTAEATARAAADSTEVTARQALSTAVTGLTNPVGATLASLTSGLVFEERTARSTAVGTLTTTTNTISARLNSGGDVANAIVTAQNTASTALTNAGTAQSAATSVATQLTTLQASIALAGANLLPNSSFEVDPSADGIAAGWSAYANNEPTTVSQVTGRTGGLAQRIAWTGTNTGVKGLYTDSAMTEGGIAGGVKGGWQPNKTYVVSWYAYGASGTAGVPMQMAWNVAPAATLLIANPGLGTGWQRYAFRITTGATVEPNGRLYVTIASGVAATGHVNIDDVMVQEGDLLTGYAPGDEPQLMASLQIESTVRASQTGALFGQLTHKIDLNGYVTGYGLASTTSGAAPSSAFIVRSDSFSVGSPSGPGISPITPFIVRTTPTSVNGVVVPVGVWMDMFYAQNGSITNAKIGNLQVDDAKIATLSVAKLVAGSLSVGQYIQSNGFTPGGPGFRIDAAGGVEVRSSDSSRVLSVNATGTQPVLKVGTALEILGNGTATFAGALSAATGTFGGTYTGLLNADQISGGAIRGINVNSASHTTRGSYLTAACAGGATTIFVKDTTDFPASGFGWFVDTLNDRDSFAYTGKTPTSLTGVTAISAHNAGATVIPQAKGMVIDAATNEMRFFGPRGDGTIDELASIGLKDDGTDTSIIFSGTVLGTRTAATFISGSSDALVASSYISGTAIEANSYGSGWAIRASAGGAAPAIESTAMASNTAVVGFSFSGIGVEGAAMSGTGLRGRSNTGYGAVLSGNATRAALRFIPQSGFPAGAQPGDMFFITEYDTIAIYGSGGWRLFVPVAVPDGSGSGG